MAKKKHIKKKKPVKKQAKKVIKKTPVKRPLIKKKIALSRSIKPTKTVIEKKAYNKWSYTKQKNRKLAKDFLKTLSKKDENSFIKFDGKRRKVKTVLNLIKLKAVKNNTKISKEIRLLEHKFKKNIRPKKRKKSLEFGILQSPAFYAWESKQAKEWVSGKRVAGNDFYLPAYYMDIDAITMLMTSGDKFKMTYNRKTEDLDKKFDIFILK